MTSLASSNEDKDKVVGDIYNKNADLEVEASGTVHSKEQLETQLNNARKFISMLQRMSWALSNLIKNHTSLFENSTADKDMDENSTQETKQETSVRNSSEMTKKTLMMQLRKLMLLMEQIQIKMELGLQFYVTGSRNNYDENNENNTISIKEEARKRGNAALALFNILRKSDKIVKRIETNVNIDIGTLPDLRTDMLQAELNCLQDDYRNEKYSTETAMLCLKHVVIRLRSIEETLEFHANLIKDRNILMNQGVNNTNNCNDNAVVIKSTTTTTSTANTNHIYQFSDTNFAYGSTPFSTFSLILSNVKFHRILREMKRNREDFLVFGSSAGWLNFYASLAFGVNSKGYEILPSLVNVANQVKRELNVGEHSSIDFYCQDMLHANLENTRIIMLCSQCWDKWLIHLVHEKLINELNTGSIIIDYNNLFESTLKKTTETSTHNQYNGTGEDSNTSMFDLFLQVKAQVSWNPCQEFHCYIKK